MFFHRYLLFLIQDIQPIPLSLGCPCLAYQKRRPQNLSFPIHFLAKDTSHFQNFLPICVLSILFSFLFIFFQQSLKWGVGIEPTNTRVAAERVNHFAIPTTISPKLELTEFLIPVYNF